MKSWNLADENQKRMYSDAIPKQCRMLLDASCVILPLFRQKTDLLRPKDLSALNAFASIWCCIENIFLAATAEHYACALRIPLGDEQEYARQAMNFPAEYVMPCFIAIGKPAGNAIYHIQNEHDLTERVHLNGW